MTAGAGGGLEGGGLKVALRRSHTAQRARKKNSNDPFTPPGRVLGGRLARPQPSSPPGRPLLHVPPATPSYCICRNAARADVCMSCSRKRRRSRESVRGLYAREGRAGPARCGFCFRLKHVGNRTCCCSPAPLLRIPVAAIPSAWSAAPFCSFRPAGGRRVSW